jgi:hypothetical protein
MEEIWKDVPEYEGLYQVSNLGRVKSLPKEWICGKGTLRRHNGKMLKLGKSSGGYLTVCLRKNSNGKTYEVHRLVAYSFLNHKPCKYEIVVDHINDNPSDNRVENLQLITQRENSFKTQNNYASKYKGVSIQWSKNKIYKYYRARIIIKNKSIYLGTFKNESDAHLAYQNALKNLEQ